MRIANELRRMARDKPEGLDRTVLENGASIIDSANLLASSVSVYEQDLDIVAELSQTGGTDEKRKQ